LNFAPEGLVDHFMPQNPALRLLDTDIASTRFKGRPYPAVQANMQRLPFADKSMRAIVCLHVLEHLPDDRAGIAELHRVLRDDGEAVIMVPFMMDQTETEEYGRAMPDWFDHYRGYSPLDFKDRLKIFDCEEILPETFLTPEECARYGIPPSQVIYLCRRRKQA
jgi:SAM-dependent methyltransferase